MLKPSKRHFLRYDAQTYETQGFIDLCGIPLKMHNDTTKDQRFSKEPRFWYVTATAITQNEDATEKEKLTLNLQQIKKQRLVNYLLSLMTTSPKITIFCLTVCRSWCVQG